MGAKASGPGSWVIEKKLDGSPEFGKKYKKVLTELANYVGGAANGGNVAAYQFLIHYTALIFQSGYEVLKETLGDVKKSKDLTDFIKKVGVGKN